MKTGASAGTKREQAGAPGAPKKNSQLVEFRLKAKMLQKVLLFHGFLVAIAKMKTHVWTAPARADRGSGNPENH